MMYLAAHRSAAARPIATNGWAARRDARAPSPTDRCRFQIRAIHVKRLRDRVPFRLGRLVLVHHPAPLRRRQLADDGPPPPLLRAGGQVDVGVILLGKTRPTRHYVCAAFEAG
jgi:hypothetical protein